MLAFTTNPRTEILRGTPFEEYLAAEGLNQSLMKLHSRDYKSPDGRRGCPARYRYGATHRDNSDTKARREGRIFHSLILEPGKFGSLYRTIDPKTAEEIYQEARQDALKAKKKSLIIAHKTLDAYRAAGGIGFTRTGAYRRWMAKDTRQVVTLKFSRSLEGMLESIHRNREVMDEISGAKLTDCEVSGFSVHTFKNGENAGKHLQLKSRFDLLPPGDAIIDAKTCLTTDPADFANDCLRYGYDLQGGHYIKVARSNGLEKNRIGFLAIEKEPPYLNCIHWLPDEWLQLKRVEHRTLLCEIAEHIRLNRWPGPESGVLMPPKSIIDILDGGAS